MTDLQLNTYYDTEREISGGFAYPPPDALGVYSFPPNPKITLTFITNKRGTSNLIFAGEFVL